MSNYIQSTKTNTKTLQISARLRGVEGLLIHKLHPYDVKLLNRQLATSGHHKVSKQYVATNAFSEPGQVTGNHGQSDLSKRVLVFVCHHRMPSSIANLASIG